MEHAVGLGHNWSAKRARAMSASANGSGIIPSVSSTSLLELRPARLQSFFHGAISIKEEGSAAADTDAHDDGDEAPNAQAELERQLRISARIGLGLLEKTESLEADNEALRIKHREQEASISQLLDRLAQSYKENAQLIKVKPRMRAHTRTGIPKSRDARVFVVLSLIASGLDPDPRVSQRAERAQANLDASEASNRQLLITLEEDRKTVKRLSAVRARSPSGHEQSLELEDLRQELNAERRRASAAEARAKRATTKLGALRAGSRGREGRAIRAKAPADKLRMTFSLICSRQREQALYHLAAA